MDLLKDGTIANQRTTLVRPPITVPPEPSAVHHLIDEDLAFAPQLDDVLDQFKGADTYVAHNADFERSFLAHLLGDALWACTYKCTLRIWPDVLSHSNQALRYRLGLVNPFGIDRHTLSPHRALSDAIVTAAVFREVTRHATWPESWLSSVVVPIRESRGGKSTGFRWRRRSSPFGQAQDSRYACAVTMNCGARARKVPLARLVCTDSSAASIRAGSS